jgi:uncharacterized membrane protein
MAGNIFSNRRAVWIAIAVVLIVIITAIVLGTNGGG